MSSAASLKHSANIANEAKMMYLVKRPTLNNRERIFISEDVTKKGVINNLKEIGSLFFEKEELKSYFNLIFKKVEPTKRFGLGRRAFITQFKPFMIKQRAQELIGSLNPKNIKTDSYKVVDSKLYKKSIEGKARAKLKHKDIKQEVTKLYDSISEELGITQDVKPRLIVVSEKNNIGGSYNTQQNSVLINTRTYKKGFLDIEEAIPHELQHSKTSLMAASLSKADKELCAKKFLLDKIKNGESETVFVKWTPLASKSMKAPKMSLKMREEFLNFAVDNLYYNDPSLKQLLSEFQEQRVFLKQKSGFFDKKVYSHAKQETSFLVDSLKDILDLNPDFCSRYASYDDALDVLLEYSISHMDRYSRFSNYKVANGKKIQVDRETAIQALIDRMESFEGNSAVSRGFGRFKNPNTYAQYIFSGDEVVAEKTAAKYLIKTYSQKLREAKVSGNLTPEIESLYRGKIERAKLIFEFREKGRIYHKNHTKLLNNSDDVALKTIVENQAAELSGLNDRIIKLSPPKKDVVIRYFDKIATIKPITMLNGLINTIGRKNSVEELKKD